MLFLSFPFLLRGFCTLFFLFPAPSRTGKLCGRLVGVEVGSFFLSFSRFLARAYHLHICTCRPFPRWMVCYFWGRGEWVKGYVWGGRKALFFWVVGGERKQLVAQLLQWTLFFLFLFPRSCLLCFFCCCGWGCCALFSRSLDGE